MKNIKDITLSIFAIIGFIAILSSFNNQTAQSNDNFERFEYLGKDGDSGHYFLFDKKNGAVYEYIETDINAKFVKKTDKLINGYYKYYYSDNLLDID